MAEMDIPDTEVKLQTFGTVGDIIQRDCQRKKKLVEIYDGIESFMKNDNMDATLIEKIKIEFGDFHTNIIKGKEELAIGECPIVIAGETSAGRSSFINLLLGVDILPQRLLSCTSTICRLRNSTKKSIIATKEDDTKEEIILNVDVNQETFKERLKDYVSRKSDSQNYKYVDIYYPIPILQDNVVIVDTPGIGTSKELTDRLFDYLPDALAFIYLINSANAGGIQPDRLIQIFDVQKDRKKRNKKLSFDTSAAIFVCNKWDQIPEDEQNEVWEFICTTLEENWVNLDRNQIFKLSVMDERKHFQALKDYTDNFKRLMTGINNIIPASLEERLAGHKRWQLEFIETLLKRIVSTIRLSKLSMELKLELKEIVELKLKTIGELANNIKKEMLAKSKKTCIEISAALFNHLQSEKTFEKMFNWQIHEFPEGDSINLIQEKGSILIQKKIDKEVRSWCKQHDVCNLPKSLHRLLVERCKVIDMSIEKSEKSLLMFYCLLSLKLAERQRIIKRRMSNFGGILVRILGGPVLSAVAGSLSKYVTYKSYLSNKEKFMRKWCKATLKTYSQEYVFACFKESIFDEFESEVIQLCLDVVPKKIEAGRKFIEDTIKEIRTTAFFAKQYRPLEYECKTLLGKLLVILMEHFSEISIVDESIEEVAIHQKIGKGAFSVVYKVKAIIQNEELALAAKTMNTPLADYSAYEQLGEIRNLRSLEHQNIVRMYGFDIKQKGSKKFLRVYLELCDHSLQQLVITDRSILPCYKNREIPSESWTFILKVMSEVCCGLEHIHDLGFVHRDLKLANILMKNGVAKISDVGISKKEYLIKGTVIGTPTHMAPEVITGKVYGSEVDIYSIGIILWELWYCRPAFSTLISETPFEYRFDYDKLSRIENRGRPIFEPFTPPVPFKTLVEKCWHQDPTLRPSATEIVKTVLQIGIE